jgi:hypothetical protein
MSVRIRYKHLGDSVYESIQNFLTKDGQLLKAGYNTVDKVFFIKQDSNVIKMQGYNNIHMAKINIKKALKEYGIVFTDEVRRKKVADETS